MSYTLKKHLSKKSNYGAKRSTSAIKYIVIHYTANDGDSDESNARYFANNSVKSSAHYFVDDDSITQSVPDHYVAWAVGGTKYSNTNITGGGKYYTICTNSNSISIELCDTKRDGKYYPSAATIQNALAFTRKLMKKYNIPQSHVIRHFDVTGKICPAYWCGTKAKNNLWKTEFYNRLSGTSPRPTKSSSTKYTHSKFLSDLKTILKLKSNASAKTILSKTITVSSTKNRTHKIVLPIQKYLNSLGYNCGKADGIAGTKFHAAVKSFQKKNNCVVDGEITARNATWKALLKIKK